MEDKEQIEEENDYYCGLCENYGDDDMCPHFNKAKRINKPKDFKCHLFW